MNSVKVMMMSVWPKHDDLSIWGMQEMQVRDFFLKPGDCTKTVMTVEIRLTHDAIFLQGGSNLPRTLD